MSPFQLPLSPAQARSLVEANRRINLWTGAIRSGKTITSLLRWCQYVANEAPKSGLLFMVGQTLSSLERNVLEPLQDPTLFGVLSKHVHHTPGKNTATIFGRTIHLVGAKDVKAFRIIRGATGAGAYVDEVSLLPVGFLHELLGRLSLPGAKLFGTTNPDSPVHWLKRDYIDRIGQLDMAHWQFTLDDNPSLTREYVAAIKAEHVGLWYRRMILGMWVGAEGVVYEDWNPDVHVVDQVPRITKWLAASLDYGTTNPFDAVLLGLGKEHDAAPVRLYVTTEHRWDPKVEQRRKTDAAHSRDLQAWLAGADPHNGQEGAPRGVKPPFLICDPSAASFIEQLLHDKVPGVTAGNNDVLDGIRTVSSLLAADRLRVHSSCKPAIEEFPSYSWDDKATARGEDKPLKVADHAMDAVRYGIHTTESLWRPQIGRLTHHAAA